MSKQRIICWFSDGAASAVAAKLAKEENDRSDNPKELLIVNIYLKNEHHDSIRFQKDCERWIGQEIISIQDTKYNADVDEVIRATRYMSGVYGARCTTELKKNVRKAFQRDNDIHVFGMTSTEENRVNNLIDAEPTLEVWPTLIEHGYTKQKCFQLILEAGITLPKMYQLGYHNNNCIGCLKATGAGYWNKIRSDFPFEFEQRSNQEKRYNTALVTMSRDKFMKKYPEHFKRMVEEWEDRYKTIRKKRTNGEPYEYLVSFIPLRFLPPDAGSHKDLDIGDCGFFCEVKD